MIARRETPRGRGVPCSWVPGRGFALLAAWAAFASILVLASAPAYACSCLVSPAAELVAAGDAAFVGTFAGRTEPTAPPQTDPIARVVNHFTVEKVIKGNIGGTVDVVSARHGATCGLELAVGSRTGLVLRMVDGEWHSGLCSQTSPEAMLALAGPASPSPAPAPAPAPAAPAPVPAPAPAPRPVPVTPQPASSPEPSPEESQSPAPAIADSPAGNDARAWSWDDPGWLIPALVAGLAAALAIGRAMFRKRTPKR